jgi:trehalose 6-phosphate synthase/phosphatase
MEATTATDILLVSNRLPVRVERHGRELTITRSVGGLPAALSAVPNVHTWIGWPGAVVEPARRRDLDAQLRAQGLAPVYLSADEERNFYSCMCNGVLWPLLHYYPAMIEFDPRAWPAYQAVNQRFCSAVVERAPPGAAVWIHDYHLLLLPELLRRARPDLRIGFFLHVPFPSQELWRILPQREELLRGMLGADYLGFHTADYLRHFINSCLRVLGIEASPDAVESGGHRTALGVDPLGPDVAAFTGLLQGEAVRQHLDRFREQWGARRLILGVERLDYSKGITHKLRAFAQLLEREPERAKDTVMLQVLVPSREENESYRALLHEIERNVGRLNGRFGSPGCMPLEFLHRSIDLAELTALYRHASLGLVTPVRDGMNLVAHEFVLCQGHPEPAGSVARGALVLSEFAGAALSLTRALPVNPWDIDGLANAISQALLLTETERTDRVSEMYERVLDLDSQRWAQRFLRRLDRAAEHNRQHGPRPLSAASREAMLARWRAAKRRALFLDYDGTLREITQRPEHAVPTAELLALLQRLATAPDTQVHLVSGRRRKTLAAWFGHLPVHLCAEHGFARRAVGRGWQEPVQVDRSWLDKVTAILAETCEQVPGSFVEVKPSGIAWHYRLADPGYGSWRARDLKTQLDALLATTQAETIPGHSVLEVRAKGVDKGSYVAASLAGGSATDFVLAAGDDRTDLDMFRQLPEGAYPVYVGGDTPAGALAVATPADLRALLADFAAADETQRGAEPQRGAGPTPAL